MMNASKGAGQGHNGESGAELGAGKDTCAGAGGPAAALMEAVSALKPDVFPPKTVRQSPEKVAAS